MQSSLIDRGSGSSMNGVTEGEAGSPARPTALRALLSRYFARRVVCPSELPRIMRKHIYTGAMGNIWASLISGIIFVFYGTSIGITRFQWGVMTGLSSWLLATQLVSAHLTERTGRRKVIWFWFAITDRSLRLVGILIAYVLWHAGWPHPGVILITAICVANFVGTMASPPWLSWLADIIPAEQHGTFLGRRSAWIAVSVIAVVSAAAWVVDWTPDGHKVYVAFAVLVFATVVGILDLIIHGTIPEPEMAMPVRNHFWLQMLLPLRDQAFRPWLVFNVAWTFGMSLGGSLVTIYFLDDLGIRNNFLGGTLAFTCLSLVGSLLTGRWSGRMVDRVGIRPVLWVGHLFWASLPVFWLLATPGAALIWIGVPSLIGGIASTAALNAANKLITRVPPAESRATYIAVSTSLASIAAGLGALAAGCLLKGLGDWSIAFAGRSFGAFHLLFALSFALRLASALFLTPRLAQPTSTAAASI